MADRLTSFEEARELGRQITRFVGELEQKGFSLSQVASAMLGTAVGDLVVSKGAPAVLEILVAVRARVESVGKAKN